MRNFYFTVAIENFRRTQARSMIYHDSPFSGHGSLVSTEYIASESGYDERVGSNVTAE